MAPQPTGTVTMVFTDIEGSTRLLDELGRERYAEMLDRHRALLRGAFEANYGYEVDCSGDAFFVAFSRVEDAVVAVGQAQHALAAEPWPDGVALRVRTGIHTGEPLVAAPNYVGIDVHRAARIMAAGHGGQVLLSRTARELLGDTVPCRDLGPHRLKDLTGPQQLYQLLIDGLQAEFPALKALHRTNLPVTATPFLGREAEIAEIAALLVPGGARVLTLTGPGGTGKTRLALQVAATVADAFPDGVWWVPLAALRDPSLVLATIARDLEVRDDPDRDVIESLTSALAGKRSLTVIDNLEHLLPDAALDIARLAVASQATLLLTSRERLEVSGERVYPVPPLVETDGVALFSERAAGRDPSFRETPAVAELCRRLDYLPLAIELAASRTTVFSPEQLLERLAERLDLFKGARDADPRQQTLRTTIEWSYNLLADEEQRLFRELSVFAGGCSYEAAEDVCGASPDALQSLVDKSLVRRRVVEAAEPRFWMLETIRQYAGEELDVAGAQAGINELHGAFYARLSDAAESGMRTSTQSEWMRRLDLERENLALAIGRSLADEQVEAALHLAASLWGFWETRGPTEGRDWLSRAIAAADGHAPAKAYYVLGRLAFFQGDYKGALAGLRTAEALARVESDTEILARTLGLLGWIAAEGGEAESAATIVHECLEVAHELDDPWVRAEVANEAGCAFLEIDNPKAARPLLEEALRLRRLLGDDRGIADSLLNLGYGSLTEGQYEEASRLLDESVAISRAQRDDFRLGLALGNSGTVALLRGRISDARRVLVECLQLCAERGDRRVGGEALLVLAATIAEEGDATRATRLAEAARSTYASIGISVFAVIADATTERLDRARAELGEARALEAEAAGRGLTLEQVVLDLQGGEATETVD